MNRRKLTLVLVSVLLVSLIFVTTIHTCSATTQVEKDFEPLILDSLDLSHAEWGSSEENMTMFLGLMLIEAANDDDNFKEFYKSASRFYFSEIDKNTLGMYMFSDDTSYILSYDELKNKISRVDIYVGPNLSKDVKKLDNVMESMRSKANIRNYHLIDKILIVDFMGEFASMGQ